MRNVILAFVLLYGWPEIALSQSKLSYTTLHKQMAAELCYFQNIYLTTDGLGNPAIDLHNELNFSVPEVYLIEQDPESFDFLAEHRGTLIAINKKSQEQYSKSWRQIIAEANAMPPGDGTVFSREALEKLHKELTQNVLLELENSLNAAQIKTLRQKVAASWISHMGLYYVLLRSDLGKQLGITPEQTAELRKVARATLSEVEAKLDDLEQKCNRQIFVALEIEVRKHYEEVFSEPLRSYVAEIDFLEYHLATYAKHIEQKIDRSRNDFRYLEQMPTKDLSGLNITIQLLAPRKKTCRADLSFLAPSINVYSQILRRPKLQKELEISKAQALKINEYTIEAWRLATNMRKELRNQLAHEPLEELIAEKQAEIYRKSEDVLLPHQKTWINNIRVHRAKRVVGLPLLIERDYFGFDYKPAAETKQKLATICKSLAKELASKNRNFCKQIDSKLLDVLTSEQKAELNSLVGGEFLHSSTVAFKLDQLRHGDNKYHDYINKIEGNE